MPQTDDSENKTILIHDLPGLDNWQLPEGRQNELHLRLIWGMALMGRRVRKGICGVNRYTRVLMPSFLFLIGADIFMLLSALFHGTLPHKLFRK